MGLARLESWILPERLPKSGARTSIPSSVAGDLLTRGRQRMGWLALAVAIVAAIMHVAYRLLFPDDLMNAPPLARTVLLGCVMALFLSSVAMWGLCWSRIGSNKAVLHWGLVYHVLGAWCVTMLNTAPKLGQGEVGAYGYADSWIVVVALILPLRPWKIAASCALCSLALPFCVWANQGMWGASAPRRELLILSAMSTVLVSAIAVFLTTLSHQMRMELTEARRLGAYQLIEKIGAGGMGEVWVAKHSLLARAAAVKIIRAENVVSGSSGSDAPVIRFEREARATAGLRSPHTVTVFDFGATGDGKLYYAMEYLEGLDLRALVKRFGPIAPARASHLLMQACDSLREAHRQGIIHRDIKPSNLFVCRLGDNYDFLKVLDFGLARDLSSHGSSIHLTQDGSTAGTPAFMAPEIALGTSRAEATSDLYSLGCVAYWLITGADVFEETSPMAVMFAHAKEKPIAPSARTENSIPPELERIVMWCLEKDPDDRPQTAGELLRSLAAADLRPTWTNDEAERWWKMHLPDVRSSESLLSSDHAPTLLLARTADTGDIDG